MDEGSKHRKSVLGKEKFKGIGKQKSDLKTRMELFIGMKAFNEKEGGKIFLALSCNPHTLGLGS